MMDYHRELLADEKRTLAFREAIRRTVKPGDVVVDIGTGSGILAFFAAEAGARHVYALEKQHTADSAAILARHLRFDDRVMIIHEQSSKVELPERADVLITETLGTFGLEEQILGFAIDARARFLRAGAALVPGDVTLHIAPVSLPEKHAEKIGWWSRRERYGFDLSPLAVFAANVMYAAKVAPEARLARPADIIHVDLKTAESAQVAGEASFVVERDGVMHGFAGWFTSTLAEGIVITNERSEMHWDQSFLPLEEPVAVTAGTAVSLQLDTHDGRGWRWRGRIGGDVFDQTTWLIPPCIGVTPR